jgi:hypothetical protein
MSAQGKSQLRDLSIAVQQPEQDVVTARIAGEIRDLALCVSPRLVAPRVALRNMAKALNVALQGDFLETRLEPVYEAARVHKGRVELQHMDYIGLGDGVMASIGKVARSFVLTLQGPDPASPRAKMSGDPGSITGGLASLLARKLNLVQEYEDKVPILVAQTLDRLESVHLITDWHRDEWEITTTAIGLDALLTPILEEEDAPSSKKGLEKKAATKKKGSAKSPKKGAKKTSKKRARKKR